jgi:hemerythrin-like domain-containing protein
MDLRAHLGAFADLLERHVRWEERELFPYAEDHVDEATLATIGGELEKRLVLARSEQKAARR